MSVKGLKLAAKVRCPKHPRYLASRAPSGRCTACNTIWFLWHTMRTSRTAVRSAQLRVIR